MPSKADSSKDLKSINSETGLNSDVFLNSDGQLGLGYVVAFCAVSSDGRAQQSKGPKITAVPSAPERTSASFGD
ncbi:hypothetical protein [Afipia sp. OHSU_II-uncloned]|nr:hypothetical protein [Afipia sp. OHSU_II-uncloned]